MPTKLMYQVAAVEMKDGQPVVPQSLHWIAQGGARSAQEALAATLRFNRPQIENLDVYPVLGHEYLHFGMTDGERLETLTVRLAHEDTRRVSVFDGDVPLEIQMAFWNNQEALEILHTLADLLPFSRQQTARAALYVLGSRDPEVVDELI